MRRYVTATRIDGKLILRIYADSTLVHEETIRRENAATLLCEFARFVADVCHINYGREVA